MTWVCPVCATNWPGEPDLEVHGCPECGRIRDAATWDLAKQVMTAEQHLAFWLRFHEDFTVTEIARMLSISRQAVDARVEGGRRRLLRAMKEAA